MPWARWSASKTVWKSLSSPPSPATVPKLKAVGRSTRSCIPLSGLNTRDGFDSQWLTLLTQRPPEKQKWYPTRLWDLISRLEVRTPNRLPISNQESRTRME